MSTAAMGPLAAAAAAAAGASAVAAAGLLGFAENIENVLLRGATCARVKQTEPHESA